MALFGKKHKKRGDDDMTSDDIPELPKLPELPRLDSTKKSKLPQLPSYPKNIVGNKFSQDAIKEAVSGEKEVYEGGEAFPGEKTMPMHPEKAMGKFSEDIGEKKI
ncbi:hypothetical protein GF378_02005, partial [Candidatus Pacearchaeota archaeon]|nr:hypothetical protein [Candidatus Pacearchaeota archaeon]